MTSHFSLHRLGFDRGNIEFFLAVQNDLDIRLSVESGNGASDANREISTTKAALPDYESWAVDIAPIEWFTKEQAIALLQRDNPFDDNYHRYDDFDKNWRISTALLEQALRNDLLETRDTFGFEISHKSLRGWAKTIGREWCVPPVSFHRVSIDGADNTDFLQQIEKLSAEMESLKLRLHAEENRNKALEETRSEHKALLARFTELSKEAAEIRNKSKTLEEDALKGKTKTSLLKLIGALAIGGYGIDIHAARMDVKPLLDDLELHGIKIDPDTIRARLKDAAEFVEPINRKT